ncbi:MAG: hypothetical protein KME45_03470 [Stenomitos rutilans HA7619-LM2]|jgi:hypothetical protein|nr:hypothetical protein [Stenomitos rutilans HA7619-LM2]MBW4469445.1 hypothetical protein [Stenomitos rutilans HA7619-LM2]
MSTTFARVNSLVEARLDDDCGKGWEGLKGHCVRSKVAHAAEHVSESALSWGVGKTVGGAIAQVAASHGFPPGAAHLISETAVQAIAATLIHARKPENRNPTELAAKFITEAAAGAIGKSSHSGAHSALEHIEGSAHAKALGAIIAGKAGGISTAVAVSDLAHRYAERLTKQGKALHALVTARVPVSRADADAGTTDRLTQQERSTLFDLTMAGWAIARHLKTQPKQDAQMPTIEAHQKAIAKYADLDYDMSGAIERLREDAEKCGRGWEGNRPGCVRAKKGGAKTASSSTSQPVNQATPKAKVEAAIEQKRTELKKQGKKATVEELKKAGESALKPEVKKKQSKATATKPTEQNPQQTNDLAILRKNYKEEDARTLGNIGKGFSDVGNLISLYADEVKTKGKNDPVITAAFDRGERNFNPALVIETGKDQYQAIGGISEKITASANASKGGRAYSVIVSNNPEQIALAKMMQVPDKVDAAHVKPMQNQLSRKEGGSGFSDNGNYQHLYTDEIATDPTANKKHKGTQGQVDAAARKLLETNGRNWVPILVHENADGSYKVVGNHFAHEVVRRAGIDRAWAVQVSSDKDERADALDQLHADAKWEPCGKGYAPPGSCKAGRPTGAVSSRHILEPHADPFSTSGQKEQQGRTSRIDQLVSKLESGRFKPQANDPNGHGKQGTLTALKDAKNPRIGLFTSHNKDGYITGAMSYKEGKSLISVQNFGADGSTKGSGSEMFNQLLHHAAKLGKGIEASSVDSAKGFYAKMGMTDQGYGQFSMSKQEVATAIAKLSRKDALDDRLTLAQLIGEELQAPGLYGAPIRIRKFNVQGKTVTGEFVGTQDGRSYAFTYANGNVTYQPAVAKLDSESANQFTVRWDSHTEALEAKVSNPVRLDATGKRLKCGSATYQCGGICQGVHRNCHKNEKAAVDHGRINKINALIEHLSQGGEHPSKGLDKPDAAKLQGVAAQIQQTRDLKAANTIAKRTGDRMVKNTPTEVAPKKPASMTVGAIVPGTTKAPIVIPQAEAARLAVMGHMKIPVPTKAIMPEVLPPETSQSGRGKRLAGLVNQLQQNHEADIKNAAQIHAVAHAALHQLDPTHTVQLSEPAASTFQRPTGTPRQRIEKLLNNLQENETASNRNAAMTYAVAQTTVNQLAARGKQGQPSKEIEGRERQAIGLPSTVPKEFTETAEQLKRQASKSYYGSVRNVNGEHRDPYGVPLFVPASSSGTVGGFAPNGHTPTFLSEVTKEAAADYRRKKQKGLNQEALRDLSWKVQKMENADWQNAKQHGVHTVLLDPDKNPSIAKKRTAKGIHSAPLAPKARSRTAADFGDKGKYKHVSLDSLSHEVVQAARSRLVAQYPYLATKMDSDCGCQECSAKKRRKKKELPDAPDQLKVALKV